MRNPSTKKQIRKTLLLQRSQLPLKQQQQKAIKLTYIVSQRPEFIFSRYIAAYWPSRGEINSLPLIQHAISLKKRCYLPVLHPRHLRQLYFVEYKLNDSLIPNRWGILEPKLILKKIIPASALDLVLMPLVAFDTQGNRLGMGGGYYDTTFSFLKTDTILHHRPYLLGLAYEFQQVKKLPFNRQDVPLSAVATEKKYYTLHN